MPSSPMGFGRGCSEGPRGLKGGSCVHVERAQQFSNEGVCLPHTQDQPPPPCGPGPLTPWRTLLPCPLPPPPQHGIDPNPFWDPPSTSTAPGTTLGLPLPSGSSEMLPYTCDLQPQPAPGHLPPSRPLLPWPLTLGPGPLFLLPGTSPPTPTLPFPYWLQGPRTLHPAQPARALSPASETLPTLTAWPVSQPEAPSLPHKQVSPSCS